MIFTKEDLLKVLNLKVGDVIYSDLFLLDKEDNKPTEFEIVMFDNKISVKALNFYINNIPYVFDLTALVGTNYHLIKELGE